MNLLLSFVFLLAVNAVTGSPSTMDIQSILANVTALNNAYSTFADTFGKEEDPIRKEIFKSNLQTIAEHNADASKGYTMGVNQFSDMTVDEVIQQKTGYIAGDTFSANGASDGKPQRPPLAKKWNSAPAKLDWRTYKMVSPVKNQGQCGSCVYFSATGALESSHALWNNGKILDLSEQELVDCAKGDGNDGCDGGTFVPTFDYLREKGLVSEDTYPYKAENGDCEAEDKEHVAQVTGWWPVKPSGNEKALMEAVAAYGPISVAIHVNQNLMNYRSGIFDDQCKGGRNHAVLVVGYGSENGKDFWIVKNSWGNWGYKGYIKMRRNKKNMCDIAGDGVIINAKQQ